MNKKIKLIIIGILLINFTGCTTYLKDTDGKTIQNEITGQSLTKNILCKPETEEITALYTTYNLTAATEQKVDLINLIDCNELTPAQGKYEGIWTTIFVKPLAWLIIKLGSLVKSYGLAIIISTLMVRLVLYPFTKKQALQSENMKKAKPDLDKLESKFKNNQSQEASMQKSQEMMSIYKKYEINPISGCLMSFVQIPLFFAYLEAINRIPVIFEETFLGVFQLGTSPAVAIFTNHQFYYIIFIVLIAGATYYSFKLNSGLSMGKEQEKQMKIMTNVMVVFMTIATFSISSGVALYWTVSNLFTIVQSIVVKRGKKNARNN